MPSLIVPVILSGGAGTRLWPSSRNSYPKQFIPLIDAKSTFSNTLRRVANRDIFAPPIIVTGWEFRFLVAEELSKENMTGRIVLEPLRRDSGPAIAVAAHIAQSLDNNATLLVLAADHLVRDIEGFEKSTLAGMAAAQDDYIVTFGIKPHKPATSYGYIEPGQNIAEGVCKVGRFIEKPSLAKARELIADGCVWNNGNFLFKTKTMLDELRKYAPEMEVAAAQSSASRRVERIGQFDIDLLDTDDFAKSPSKSIDFAVMEKSDRVAVVSAQFDWSDLGSWEALWEVNAKDKNGNVAFGPATLSETANCFVSSDGIHLAVVGLEGLTVVATKDAVLVAPRHIASELKPLVALLDKDETTKQLARRHMMSKLPWGWEDILLETEGLTVKRMGIKPGARLALHKRMRSHVHYLNVRGTCTIMTEDKEYIIRQNEEFSIPEGRAHRLCNLQDDELEIIETQTGEALDANAVIWLHDDYGRC